MAATWEVTAPTPANTMATKATPAPKATEPVAGVPTAVIETAMRPPRRSEAPSATRTPARSGACRPTTADRSSSTRPSSSSPRVERTTPSTVIIPAIVATKVPTRQTVKPPAVARSVGGPSMARMVGLADIVVMRRSAFSGSMIVS